MRAVTVFACMSLLLLGALAEPGDELLFVEEEDLFGDDNEGDDLFGEGELSSADETAEESEWLKEDTKIDAKVYNEKEDEDLKLKKLKDAKASACPKDFVYNAELEFCFKVVEGRRGSIYTGEALCKRLVDDGRLVELNTKDKFEAVENVIMDRGHVPSRGYILGARSPRSHVSNYKWLSGEKMVYANWCEKYPKHKKTCVRLIKRGDGMCWDDDCCYRPKYFICEKLIA